MTRGSSIDGLVVDVGGAHDREVGVFEQLQGRPFERTLGEDESQHRRVRVARRRAADSRDRSRPASRSAPWRASHAPDSRSRRSRSVPRGARRRDRAARSTTCLPARRDRGTPRAGSRSSRRTRRRSRPAPARARCARRAASRRAARCSARRARSEVEDLGEVLGRRARARRPHAGSKQNTTWRGATRCISRSPRSRSVQWCTVSTASAASNASSANGKRLGDGLHRGRGAGRALSQHRRRRIDRDDGRSVGS